MVRTHSSPSPRCRARRAGARLALAASLMAGVGVALAGAASAHVVITPDEAAPGGYATLAFQVPNESDTASTTQFEVQFPADHPIASVRTEPVPGWTAEVKTAPLPEPLTDDDGNSITEAVSTITWTGGSIDPGQFQRFPFSVGPLPEDADSLEFKAVQTYSDGEVSRWIDPPNADGSEPESPAPVLTLSADAEGGHGHDDEAAADDSGSDESTGHDEAADSDSSSDDDSDSATTLAIVGIVVGALGLVTAIIALTRKPKAPTTGPPTPTPTPTPEA